MTIRVRKKIESETLHLPELRQLIGRTVDIIVEDGSDAPVTDEFRNPPSLDELIARHDARPRPPSTGYQFTAADFEGFDEAVRQWRSEGRAASADDEGGG